MELTTETYERLRKEAEALGFLLVPDSDDARSFMQHRTYKEWYEEWRVKHPNDDTDFETWLAKALETST